MDVTLRSFEISDYEAVARLWSVIHPSDKLTAEELAHQDTFFKPPYMFGRFVAEADGELVGAGTYMQHPGVYHPQKFHLEVHVYPDFEGRGIGQALYAQVRKAIAPFAPSILRGQVKEEHAHARVFAEKRGFTEDKRDWEAILRLDTFEASPFHGTVDELEAQGFVFRSLAELEGDSSAQRKFYDLFSEVRRDAPRTEEVTDIPFEMFVKGVFEAPDFTPNGNFVALYEGEYIGLTQLWKGNATDELFTGLTGVKQAFRGRRLALALKLKSIDFARLVGAPVIHTDNDTTNMAMLAINDKLGFVRQPARISMVKELNHGAEWQ